MEIGGVVRCGFAGRISRGRFFFLAALVCVALDFVRALFWGRGRSLQERVSNYYSDAVMPMARLVYDVAAEAFGGQRCGEKKSVVREEVRPVVARLVQVECLSLGQSGLPEGVRVFQRVCLELSMLGMVSDCHGYQVCDFEGNEFEVHLTDRFLKICGYPMEGYDELDQRLGFVVFWALIYNELPKGCSKAMKKQVESFAKKHKCVPLLALALGRDWVGQRYHYSGQGNLALCFEGFGQRAALGVDAEVFVACSVREHRDVIDGVKERLLCGGSINQHACVLRVGDGGDLAAVRRGHMEIFDYNDTAVVEFDAALSFGHDYGDGELVTRALNGKIFAIWEGSGSVRERCVKIALAIDDRAFFATEINLRCVEGCDAEELNVILWQIRDGCPLVRQVLFDGDLDDEVVPMGWQGYAWEATRGTVARRLGFGRLFEYAVAGDEGNQSGDGGAVAGLAYERRGRPLTDDEVDQVLTGGDQCRIIEEVDWALAEKVRRVWNSNRSFVDKVMDTIKVFDGRARYADEVDLRVIADRYTVFYLPEVTISAELILRKVRERCPRVRKVHLPETVLMQKMRAKVFYPGWNKVDSFEDERAAVNDEDVERALGLARGEIATYPRLMRAAIAFRHFLYTAKLPYVPEYQRKALFEDLGALDLPDDLKNELNELIRN